jgi:hypothetical protein
MWRDKRRLIDEYRRFGDAITGYPLSNRFIFSGTTAQIFQRVVMLWNASAQQVEYLDIFDALHQMGADDLLFRRWQIPPPASPGLDSPSAGRLHDLDSDADISAFYQR